MFTVTVTTAQSVLTLPGIYGPVPTYEDIRDEMIALRIHERITGIEVRHMMQGRVTHRLSGEHIVDADSLWDSLDRIWG